MLNRKKIIAALMCTTLAVTMLYGCTVNINTNSGSETVEEKEDEDNAETEEGEDTTKEEDVAIGPELESVDFDLSEYDKDNKHKVFECYGNSFLCTKDSEGQFPALAQALKSIDETEKDTYRATMDEFREDADIFAKQQAEEGGDYSYFCYCETELKTADSLVVSLLRTEYGYLGGAHPDYYFDTFNINTQTGEDIYLSDIITDRDALNGILIDKLNEKYPDGNFFDLNDSLESYWLDEKSGEEGAVIYSFTMDPSGLSFYFGPYDLNSYADGSQQVDLSYEDLKDILKEDFIYAGEKNNEEEVSEISYTDLYIEKAKELNKAGDADQFALIDVDGDDIPEFVASSSEGSWDKDQIFLFTIKDGEVSLLASDIGTGMEGHYIAFFKGENIIDCSGAALGERHDYYEIKEGELNPILSLQYFDDPEKDNETVYFVDEEETDEDTYNETAGKFFKGHDTMISLDTEAMTEYTIKWAGGYADLTKTDSLPYMSLEELLEELAG